MPQSTAGEPTIKHPGLAYQRIENDLRSKIRSGHWPSGVMLPSRKDLAREYTVSLNTVERAISALLGDGTLRAEYGRGTFVADDTDRAIEAPVPRARPTAKATVGIISHLQPQADLRGMRDHFAEVITNSLERTITASGGITRFFNLYRSEAQVASPSEAVTSLLEQGVDAIAFVYSSLANELIHLPAAVRAKTPFVFIGSARSIHPALSVYYDSQDAGYQAAYYLLENGVPDLLFFSPYTTLWVQERLEGARQAVLLAGLPGSTLQVSVAEASLDSLIQISPEMPEMHQDYGYAAARTLLAQGLKTRGVIAANDRVALGFRQAAKEVGLIAGRDYALLGFDGTAEARAAGLTTLRPPLEELGQEAGRLLLNASTSGGAPIQVCLHSVMIARASSRLPDRI